MESYGITERNPMNRKHASAPTMKNVESDIFQGIAEEGLLGTHDSPHVQYVSSGNVES